MTNHTEHKYSAEALLQAMREYDDDNLSEVTRIVTKRAREIESTRTPATQTNGDAVAMDDMKILSFLAGKYVLRYDGNSNDCSLVHTAAQVTAETISRFINRGWLESFANSGGFRLSDEGFKAYMRSTDELSAAHHARKPKEE